MDIKVLLFVALFSMALGAPAPQDDDFNSNSGSDEDDKYSFEWEVDDTSSENHYGHRQSYIGGRTEGSYYVRLPDTRLMKVSYYVDDDSGFVADVSFEGSAEFDDISNEINDDFNENQRRRRF